MGRDGIEPPQQMRGVYNALGSPVPSLPVRSRVGSLLLEVEEGEGVEPSTQRSARLSRPVAHHCAPPSVNVNVKWSGRLDSNQRPPASKAGALAGLSYTLLRNWRSGREIESLSPDRQSGRLTRCVTEQRIGASGPTRTATECALNALPLPIGVQTRIRRSVSGVRTA